MQPPYQVLYSPLGSQIIFSSKNLFKNCCSRRKTYCWRRSKTLRPSHKTLNQTHHHHKTSSYKPKKTIFLSCKRPLDTTCEKPDSLVPATAQTAPQPHAPAPKKPRLQTQPETRAPPVDRGCQPEAPKRGSGSATQTAKEQQTARTTRRAAFRQAKQDANIPVSQQPEKVKRPFMELPKSSGGHKIKDKSGNLIKTRDYYYKNRKSKKIIIQDHGAGHEKGNQGPHFNVRPIDKPRKGSVEGTKTHYPFDK